MAMGILYEFKGSLRVRGTDYCNIWTYAPVADRAVLFSSNHLTYRS